MSEEREQLHERYLESRLREELGPPTDLSDAVLRRIYSQPRRVIPPPRRTPWWRPLAAAASVLLLAGLAVWAIVSFWSGPKGRPLHEVRDRTVAEPTTPSQPRPAPKPAPKPDHTPTPEKQSPTPSPKPAPKGDGTGTQLPTPDKGQPGKDLPPGYTDPPGAFPDPEQPPPVIPGAEPKREDVETPQPAKPEPGPTEAVKTAVVAREFKASRKDGLRVTRAGAFEKRKAEPGFEILSGDRLQVSGWVDVTLTDGTLLRLDGEVTLTEKDAQLGVELHDGAFYADTARLNISAGELAMQLAGIAVVEERLRELDLHLIEGKATSGEHELFASLRSRLGKEGFNRSRSTTWADVSGEYKFLRDVPVRRLLREDLADAPGELWGGEIKDGVLTGPGEKDRGVAFYLREKYTTQQGASVRVRFRIQTTCDLVIQLGADENYRCLQKAVRGGEWHEIEIPLGEFFRTLQKSGDLPVGTDIRRFQIHGEDGDPQLIEIDWVEFNRRPG
ncbi:MAG: hypothetical protein IT464_01885 [Planctomycetes bacterium]|nr:hypothetical protein [Planctomycetota bacterium]